MDKRELLDEEKEMEKEENVKKRRMTQSNNKYVSFYNNFPFNVHIQKNISSGAWEICAAIN